MTMKKLTLLSLAMAALCALPTLVLAEDPAATPNPPGDKPAVDKPARRPGGPGGEGGAGRMDPAARLKMMTEKLDLTQDQQDKIKAIQEKNGPEFKELMAKGRDNLTDADKTKLRELMKSQMEEIVAILTPEQREKMKELRGARGAGGDRKAGRPGAPKATPATPAA